MAIVTGAPATPGPPTTEGRNNSVMRRFSLVVGLLAVAAVAVGCGSGDDQPDEEIVVPIPDISKEKNKVRGAVDRFRIAAEELDAKLLCNDVLPPSSISEDLDRCEAAIDGLMQDDPSNWQPYGTVRRIQLIGDDRAKARAIQGESKKTIRFAREDGRWYVEVFD